MADGFYRVPLNPDHVARLGVIIPPSPHGERLVALPLALPMGWVNSPPLFTAVMETITDVANRAFLTRQCGPPGHRLEAAAAAQDRLSPATPPAPGGNRRRPPLVRGDVYVDDFIVAAQGDTQRLGAIRRTMFGTIDHVFRPLGPTDPPSRQEPISTKKLGRGDGAWDTRKEILGWELDTVAGTITLPNR